MRDIRDKDDVIIFVKTFYSEVRDDEMIGPIFGGRIEPERWPVHLERMSNFWNTVLFGAPDYRGNPFSHHISLNIDERHFNRWITLFKSVVNKHYEGPKADEAILRADNMKRLFESKLKYIADNPNQLPIM